MAKPESVRTGSGNVFADLGLAQAEERLAKAELARAIGKTIGARNLTQREAEGGINRATRELVNAFDGVGGRSDAIATSATFLGRPEYVNELFPRVQAVTSETMVQVANEWFIPERRATLYILPESRAEGGE